MSERNAVEILGVPVDSLKMAEAVGRVAKYIENYRATGIPAQIATANPEMIMRAREDAELLEILNSVSLVLPDGAGAVWAARHLGQPLPERVAGYDLVQELLKIAPQKNYRFFFFGAAAGVAEKARDEMLKKYPAAAIVGCRNGYFSTADEPKIIEEIRAARADILLCALGVPKQEKWLRKNLAACGVAVGIGVGGSFDVMSGNLKRAPLWMRKANLEWVYRGAMQPSRLGRFVALPRFMLAVRRAKPHQD